MIGTIGSLVQETRTFRTWLLAASLYTAACTTTAVLLGFALSVLGHGGTQVLAHSGLFDLRLVEGLLISSCAVAYALSDVGVIRLPRPTFLRAVPASWWRRWAPFGAAVAYGATLGLGVTTRIRLGGTYVILLLALVSQSPLQGALLVGAYGLSRGFSIFPGSLAVYRSRFSAPHFDSAWLRWEPAELFAAAVLLMVGVEIAIAALLNTGPGLAWLGLL
jgi:hypothetical protein